MTRASPPSIWRGADPAHEVSCGAGVNLAYQRGLVLELRDDNASTAEARCDTANRKV